MVGPWRGGGCSVGEDLVYFASSKWATNLVTSLLMVGMCSLLSVQGQIQKINFKGGGGGGGSAAIFLKGGGGALFAV